MKSNRLSHDPSDAESIEYNLIKGLHYTSLSILYQEFR